MVSAVDRSIPFDVETDDSDRAIAATIKPGVLKPSFLVLCMVRKPSMLRLKKKPKQSLRLFDIENII